MEELIKKWDTDQKVLDKIDADEGHEEGEEEENVRMYVCMHRGHRARGSTQRDAW